MENMKLRIANNIMIEVEAIKECRNVDGSLLLAELMTHDAINLAKIIILEEERKKRMNVLLIDDIRNSDFIEVSYGVRPTAEARTFDEGIKALETGKWDILYLDHDLAEVDMAKTGYGIMNFLEANPQFLPKEIVLVTSNPVGRRQMQVVIDKLYRK